jgi:hypothetical protein
MWVLPRRKYELPARHQMYVQMKDRLSAVRICIDDYPVSILRKSLITGYLRRNQQHMAQDTLMLLICLIKRIKMFARDDQDMSRGLRRNVIERNAIVVLENRGGRYRTLNYPAKDAIISSHRRLG